MQRDEKPAHIAYSKYLGYGMTWAFSTLLFLYLGTKADEWLGTKPALTVIGAFVGAAAGFYYLYRGLVSGNRKP
jgi:hypothetical protein